ncbi:MAG TPA: carboxymuconolactone decarboxylase family protein [Acetobacteraceae bacterium]|nr:carboxymuconolactone decarboxylase family protein [Acetobacteraceae bacterium]
MFDMAHFKRVGPMGQLAPEAMAGLKVLDAAALAEGVIPKKYKELTAVAVALTTQCPYCIVRRRSRLARPTLNSPKPCSSRLRCVPAPRSPTARIFSPADQAARLHQQRKNITHASHL